MRSYWKMVLALALTLNVWAGICTEDLQALVRTNIRIDGRALKYFYNESENRVLEVDFIDAETRWYAIQIIKKNNYIKGRAVRGKIYMWGDKRKLYRMIMLFRENLTSVTMTDHRPEDFI